MVCKCHSLSELYNRIEVFIGLIFKNGRVGYQTRHKFSTSDLFSMFERVRNLGFGGSSNFRRLCPPEPNNKVFKLLSFRLGA